VKPPLRGTSSLGVTGFTTPRYPSVFFSFRFVLPLSFAFFLPSRVGEGALHEKRLPLCLLRASRGQQIYPHVLAVRGVPLDGWYISVPGVSIGWYPSHMAGLLNVIKRRGHSLGLALRVVTVPGGDSERMGSGYHHGKCRGWKFQSR
ncbi:hypothetical protein AVEN_94868-1, partial [Araneus ventricosus]